MSLVEELRALGAKVAAPTAGANEREIKTLEREIGFDLPAEYRSFLRSLGSLQVNDTRFYGVKGARTRNASYRRELGTDDTDGGSGRYIPKRFMVLSDRGDHSNAGEGMVFDADLDALLATDGRRWIEKREAHRIDYWSWLAEELESLRTDVGEERERAKQHEASKVALRHAGSTARDLEDLYAVFASYEKAPRWNCFTASCKACVASNHAFDRKELRKLTAKDLAHYVDRALTADQVMKDAVLPTSTTTREQAFKHFLPRCLELIHDVGNHEILREQLIFTKGLLSANERAAVVAWLERVWQVMLHSSATSPLNVTIFLRCVPDLAPYLSAWTNAAVESDAARALKARCADDVERGRDSLLSYDALNAEGAQKKRAIELARWLAGNA